MLLGVDLGTTRTVIADVSAGDYPVVHFDIGGEFRDHLPGWAVLESNALCFGDLARDAMSQGKSACVSSVKRAISGLAPDDVVDALAPTTALELLAAYLDWIREMLLGSSNLTLATTAPIPAMVAVPALAGTRQRYLTLEAFRLAGFDVRGMLNEPTAAAIEFAHRHRTVLSARSPKQYVVVYDLGGGTFDTAAIRFTGRRFELLQSAGLPKLGGSEFDELLLELACEPLGITTSGLTPGDRVRVLEVCREAKEALRPNTRRLLLDFSAIDGELGSAIVEVADFYTRCEALVSQTFTIVDQLLERLTRTAPEISDPQALAALYLVGGASALPIVGRKLRERVGRKLRLAPQPHAATAIGLAVAGDASADIFVREAITRHLGVWRESDSGHEKIFDPILPKDAAPREQSRVLATRSYRPAHRVGHLRFVECSDVDDQGQPAGNLLPCTEVRFPYDPALADRDELTGIALDRVPLDQEIVETYASTPEGGIQLIIENRTSRYQRSYLLGA